MNGKEDSVLSSPLAEALRPMIEARNERIAAHDRLRASKSYRAAIKHLERIAAHYIIATAAIDLNATRHPPFFDSLITLRLRPHFVQSTVAALSLVKEGMLQPARRELRFLVEASVKTLWLDRGNQQENSAPSAENLDVTQKVTALDNLGSRKFREIVSELDFGLLRDDDVTSYRQTATDLYSKLSTYAHVSAANVKQDLVNFDNDQSFGFETVHDIQAIAQLMKRVLDLALASNFEAFDHGLVGDILVNVFDDEPRWIFRKTQLIGAINRHFDYKSERQ